MGDLGLLLTIGCLIASAVWAVSRIKTTVEVLVERITHLTSSMEKLERAVTKVDNDFQRLESRVRTLESAGVPSAHIPQIAKAVVEELQKAT